MERRRGRHSCVREAKSGLNKQHTSCPSANSMMVPPKVQREATYSRPPLPIGMGYCQTTLSLEGGRGTSPANYPTACFLIGPRLTDPMALNEYRKRAWKTPPESIVRAGKKQDDSRLPSAGRACSSQQRQRGEEGIDEREKGKQSSGGVVWVCG